MPWTTPVRTWKNHYVMVCTPVKDDALTLVHFLTNAVLINSTRYLVYSSVVT